MRSHRFGIVRNLDMARTRAQLGEICEMLGSATGTSILPHHALTYRELADAMTRGDLAIAWLPPLLCIELKEAKLCEVLALPVRRQATSYHSVLIARTDARVELANAQGLRTAWVEPESSAGHLVMRLHLASLGHDLTKMLGRETFVHSHDAVVDAVLMKRADIGATYCAVAPGTQRIVSGPWKTKASEEEITTLALAGPIPNDTIVVTNAVSKEARKNLLAWLLDPPARGKELCRELLSADAFREASPAHFATLERMVARAKTRGTA